MYRKVVSIPLLLFVALSAGSLYPVTWLLWDSNAGFDVVDTPPGILTGAFTGLWLMLLVLALCWAAAFYPGRRYPLWQALLKYGLAAVAAGVAVWVLLDRGEWAAEKAFVLLEQTHAPPVRTLLASYLLRSLPEAAALSLFLAAPFYWLIRGIQVRSLPRATFEAWVEAKRLILPGLVLVMAGAALEIWAGPALVSWILR